MPLMLADQRLESLPLCGERGKGERGVRDEGVGEERLHFFGFVVAYGQ